MVNTLQQNVPQQSSITTMKVGSNSRRPFQPRSVNSPSPAKSKKATKPQINPLKARPEKHAKLAVVSENASAWSTMTKEELRTPSLDSEPEVIARPSIFRRRPSLSEDDEEGDFFVLKRANPVYDSDDEDFVASPTKRQRTSQPSSLHWQEQLSDNEDGTFSLSFLPTH